MITINIDECNKIYQEANELNKQLENKKEEIKKLLPKGYWWTCDIDPYWKKPKKYSIKKIDINKYGILLTIKEVFKKRPWPSFTGEHIYYLEEFSKLKIGKTADEAETAYHNRICPKCGGIMKESTREWCFDCITERSRIKKEFESNHRFYCPSKNNCYQIEYTDELTRDQGYSGKRFVIQRIDTNEIIETNNLWVVGRKDNADTLPKIEFLYSELVDW